MVSYPLCCSPVPCLNLYPLIKLIQNYGLPSLAERDVGAGIREEHSDREPVSSSGDAGGNYCTFKEVLSTAR